MELAIKTIDGNPAQTLKVNKEIFSREYNESLIHHVVVAYQAAGRAGTKAQKTRSEVRGGGIKPWKQKGTGRARAGSIRSPLWRGGAVVFAAKPRDFSQKVNRKMAKGAMCCIVSELIRSERAMIVDQIKLEAAKTKMLVALLNKMQLDRVLIVTADYDESLERAARNLHYVSVKEASKVDPVSLVSFENVLITAAAVEKLQERLS